MCFLRRSRGFSDWVKITFVDPFQPPPPRCRWITAPVGVARPASQVDPVFWFSFKCENKHVWCAAVSKMFKPRGSHISHISFALPPAQTPSVPRGLLIFHSSDSQQISAHFSHWKYTNPVTSAHWKSIHNTTLFRSWRPYWNVLRKIHDKKPKQSVIKLSHT